MLRTLSTLRASIAASLLLLLAACSSETAPPAAEAGRCTGAACDAGSDGPVGDLAGRDGPAGDQRGGEPQPVRDQRGADQLQYSGSFPSGSGVHDGVTLTVGGQTRSLWTYLPAGLSTGRPLLIVFHGTDNSGWDALQSSGAMTLADAQKLVVVAPQARTMKAGDWDNHVAGQKFFETYPATSPTSNNDLLLVQAIILEAQRAHGCDPRRVYTLGFSNGAFFSAFAALTLPDCIAAFGEASGGLVRCATTGSCSFYSQSGATSCATLAGEAGYCSCGGTEKPAPLPTTGRKPPGYLSHAVDDVTVSVYYSCDLAARMQALGYTTSVKLRSGGGHAWPASFALDAWPFLSQHALP